MKVNKFFAAAGALVLTVAGAVAGRAAVKAGTDASAIYFSGNGISCTAALTNGTATSVFTTGGSGTVVTFKTGVHTYNAYATSHCGSSHVLRFNP